MSQIAQCILCFSILTVVVMRRTRVIRWWCVHEGDTVVVSTGVVAVVMRRTKVMVVVWRARLKAVVCSARVGWWWYG